MEELPAAVDVSLHNFSMRQWEQLAHFHVMRLMDSLFLWVGAMPHLRNFTVAMCSCFDSILPGRPANRCLSTTTSPVQTITSHYS
ncbi:proteasome assembly chaperone 4-like isoform X2 [Rattus norvegicus]|uniref:proteasome assembly chaperone 4-like isoform X2 n=1 Tax=Rattus norvegicus TaxID=10116 RepID=UPI0003D09E43|nr:proteasome assembly chaperone 4-like isoform X2 [Rattus norvegicus]